MTAAESDALSPSACAIADRMLGSASEAEDVGQEGDLHGLELLLTHDVVVRGGKAPAAARAVHDHARVADLLIAGLRTLAPFGRRELASGNRARCSSTARAD
jgi:hypothetical protein